MTGKNANSETSREIDGIIQAAVQVVALRAGTMGNMVSAWTGSGTVIHPEGIILTNCHVVNPRAMGMSAPEIDRLAIAIAGRSDEPPALTYFVEVIAQAPQLDLALLRIAAGLNGRPVAKLNLPFVRLGDSDALELGDSLRIFGYPGIGGDTITFTSGSVSGFSDEEGITARRAWIKTDATIAGGNSGGTAVDENGSLVGIPTQAAAGTNVRPVDARPVIDTNRDGRVDSRDTPLTVGGFINGLRPVNLVQPLLQKAGIQLPAASAGVKQASLPALKPAEARPAGAAAGKAGKTAGKPQKSSGAAPGGKAVFNDLVFSIQVTPDGRPVHAAAILPAGIQTLYAGFEYENMQKGLTWQQTWIANGNIIANDTLTWNEGKEGRKTLALRNPQGFPSGEYALALSIERRVVAEGKVVLGRRVEDNDTEISGQVLDQATGRGLPGVMLLAIKPGVNVMVFLRQQQQSMIFSAAQTDAQGNFTFPQQLPKGQAYGLVVLAKGYRSLAIQGALRLGAEAPEQAQINPIALQRG